MPARSHTMRLDIAAGTYDVLEAHAAEEDISVGTLVRRILIEWTYEHPPPSTESDDV